MTTADSDDLAGLIPERRRHTVQHSISHEHQSEADPFRKSQPVKYCEGISHAAIKSEQQMSSSVKYSLEASLKIGRKSNTYEVAIVEPRMHERHHQRTEAVIGDV